MQVNSVSLAGNTKNASFKSMQREFETLVALDDNQVRQIAYAKASHDVNDKKHKRISNALYFSIPIAAGLASAVRAPKAASLTRALRVNNFVTTALQWAGTFLAIDLVFGAKRKLDKVSPAMNKFSQENPVLSTLGTIGASIAALWGLGKGSSKLVSKLAAKVTPEQTEQATKLLNKFSDKLNNNKFLNNLSKQLEKVPSGIKAFGKGVLDYSPMLLIVSSIAHSFGHDKVKANEFANNYRDIKLAQAMVRQGMDATQELDS